MTRINDAKYNSMFWVIHRACIPSKFDPERSYLHWLCIALQSRYDTPPFLKNTNTRFVKAVLKLKHECDQQYMLEGAWCLFKRRHSTTLHAKDRIHTLSLAMTKTAAPVNWLEQKAQSQNLTITELIFRNGTIRKFYSDFNTVCLLCLSCCLLLV